MGKIGRIGVIMLGVFLLATVAFSGVAQAITNGQLDGDNHPAVVLIVFDDAPGHPAWRCTGTLISSRVVLTAAHCADGAVAARIFLGPVVQGNPDYPYGGQSSYEGTPYVNPGYYASGSNMGLPGFNTHDVGIVVLSESVPTNLVPPSNYGVLPSVGYVDTLPDRTNLDQVGYGVQYQLRGGGLGPYDSWAGPKIRMISTSQIISGKFSWSDQYIRCTANPGQGKGGTAFGDSGGPNYLGGTNTILAVTSYGTNSNCAGVSYIQRIDKADILSWITSFTS